MITIIVIEEILMANGMAVLMMCYLLTCRRINRENFHTEDKIYDAIAIVNILGALSETIAFIVDGKIFSGSIMINYIFNSLCFIGTVSMGLLWCLYVELRIYRNYKRTFQKTMTMIMPWIVEFIIVVLNFVRPGIMFIISDHNEYQRTGGSLVAYIAVIIYLAYSIYLVYHSRNQGVNLSYFPVMFLVCLCLSGIIIQLSFYGITSSWLFASVTMIFVQMQSYAESLYTDELSGLYNRRYFNAVLAKKKIINLKSLYGIMIDINDFKLINDNFGHSIGDRAISTVGNILFRSIPDAGMAIRYAGDEFIVLLAGTDANGVLSAMDEIDNNISAFNESKTEPFTLSLSMGYVECKADDDAESFLRNMDEKMYEEKRKYHFTRKSECLSNLA